MRVPFTAVACACAVAPTAVAGVVIDDPSFFDDIEHTLLDFETKGDGSLVDLPFLGRQVFSGSEYNNFGVNLQTRDSLSSGMKWIDTPPPNADTILGGGIGDSLDAVGSWPTAIGGGDDWTITFSVPVHAVGIGVVQAGWGFTGPAGDRVILKELQTHMRAFSAGGRILGEAVFYGDLVDGGFGGPFLGGDFGEEFDAFPFGFLGVFSPDRPIDHVRFTHGVDAGVIFDDLHFSALPAPGPGAALALTALSAGLRRRR